MGEAQNLRLQWATLAPAVIKVGNGGRGFVLETERGKRIVVTAAHCLRRLPPAHPWSHAGDTYPRLLGPLGKARPTVRAECLFADPLADIAVLGAPDDQDFPDQADAYQQLTSVATPFGVADAPKQRIERVEAPYPGGEFSGSFEVPTPGKGDALVLSLEGEWCKCTVTRRGAWLSIDQKAIVKSGMSGSPIVSPSGKAIGLVSTGDLNPLLVQALPPRIWQAA